MVEAATSTVFHSFFTSANRLAFTQASSSRVTLDAAVKSVARRSVALRKHVAGVIPRASPSRVEDLPLDEQCRRWLVEYGYHHQFYAMAHNKWCTDRDRLFMWKEIVPQRRSYIKTIISNILHLSTFHSPSTSLHALLRYASTSTALNHAPSPTADPLQYLRQSSYSRYFRPEDGWRSYNHLRNANALDQLSLKQVLGFAERLIDSVEGVDAGFNLDSARTWGLRLGDIMQELQLRGLRRPDSLRDGCLAARIAALRGEVQGALTSVKELSMLEKSENPLLSVYSSCLLATWRYHGHAEAFDFLEQHWSVFRRPAIRPPRAKDDEQVKAARNILRDLIASLESPVDMITEKADKWPAERTKSVGRLLVEVLCHAHRPNDALAVDRFMEEHSLCIQLNSRLSIVRALARAEDFALANELFTTITDSASQEETSTPSYNSTALQLHAQQGNVSEAQHYLAQLPAPSETDKAMLMHASAHHGSVAQVVEQFQALFSSGSSGARPDVVHYTTVIYAHAQAEDFDGMNEWLDRMTQDGIQPDEYVYNTVLRSFAARGDIDSVAAILDQMRSARIFPSVISYTIAMKLLANMRNPSAVELLYKRAMREGIKPDRYMLTTVMNAHTEAGSWNGVIRVFDYFNAKQIPLTIEVYNTLLKAYVLIGAPFRVVAPLAQRMHSQGLIPDQRTYALLIQSACDSKLMEVARDLFYEMDEHSTRGRVDLKVNNYVMTIIMSGYLRLKRVDMATKVFDDMMERGIPPAAVTYAQIVKQYVNVRSEESLQMAANFVDELLNDPARRATWLKSTFGRASAQEVLLSPLLSAYAKRPEKVAEVERLAEDHINAGNEAPLSMLVFLLDAYRRAFDMDKLNALWPQIVEMGLQHGRVKSLMGKSGKDDISDNDALAYPLSIYLDAQSCAGEHDKIAQAWAELSGAGFTFTSHNWNHLAVTLCHAGQPAQAFEVVERVLLPYQRKSQRAIRDRNLSPESPLLTDILAAAVDEEAAEIANDSSAFETHGDIRNTASRTRSVSNASRHIAYWYDQAPGDRNDDAHALHVLYRFSPEWNYWAPHRKTLTTLSKVLQRLERGHTMPPLPSRIVESSDGNRHGLAGSSGEDDAENARAMLDRIRYSSPRTVRLIRDFEDKVAQKAHTKEHRRRQGIRNIGPRSLIFDYAKA